MAQNPVRAAQYVRMSTEHQRYSPGHQNAAIAAYAEARGYDVVLTYADLGLSGLNFNSRPGLKGLIADIAAGQSIYSTVLVYDVSRWGRFQDPDQSAHYEFLCRAAGVAVEYCAEEFDNDGSVSSTILKLLKRVMAAEFSRELSVKVLRAQLRLAGKGMKMGGAPGYGLRRLLIDRNGEAITVLEHGERNNLRSNRVILVPGPADEIATVRRIYRLFLVAGLRRMQIVKLLNAEGVPFVGGAKWGYSAVHRILTEEKYAGVYVYNRTTDRLGATAKHNPKDEWVRVEGAIIPLIDRKTFDAVQAQLHRPPPRSNEELIEELRLLNKRHGRLTNRMIDEAENTPSIDTYVRRFGSTDKAFELAGFTRPPKQRRKVTQAFLLDHLRQVLATNGRLNSVLIERAPGAPMTTTYRTWFGSLMNAYKLIGYDPKAVTWPMSNARMIAGLRAILKAHGDIRADLINAEPSLPHASTYRRRFGSLMGAYALAGFTETEGRGRLKRPPPDFKITDAKRPRRRPKLRSPG